MVAKMKYPDIIIQPLAEHRYKVLREIQYKDVTVEAGYRTNGADIPRVFWWAIPPNSSDCMPAVIVHDKMCDTAKAKWQYEKADRYFEEILISLNVSKFKRKAMVLAVKFYTKHIRKYKKVRWS